MNAFQSNLLAALALAAASFPPSAIAAADASHDPHKLSAEEERIVLPAICRNAIREKHQFKCAALIGYPSDGAAFNATSGKASGEISFATIAYGNFTTKGTEEAYVTYLGIEPHADNFGGGILLRGTKNGWNVERWVPGGQMDNCVALPDSGLQRMLCLSGYTGMGETDSSVWILDASALGHGGALKRDSVLKAQDGREASNTDAYCKGPASAHQSMLLSIDDLTRSQQPGILATSKITYADATNVREACTEDRFADVGTQNGVLRYRLSQGKVVIDPPPKFAPVDY
jgi:hypothetical protein